MTLAIAVVQQQIVATRRYWHEPAFFEPVVNAIRGATIPAVN